MFFNYYYCYCLLLLLFIFVLVSLKLQKNNVSFTQSAASRCRAARGRTNGGRARAGPLERLFDAEEKLRSPEEGDHIQLSPTLCTKHKRNVVLFFGQFFVLVRAAPNTFLTLDQNGFMPLMSHDERGFRSALLPVRPFRTVP